MVDHPGLSGPRLVIQNTGQVYRLTKARTTIGRQADNTIVLSDPQVSRHHAVITWQAGAFVIQDLDSANGTYLDQQRVSTAQPLRHGDTLRLGDTVLSVNLAPEAAVLPQPEGQADASPQVPTEVQQRSSLTPVILGLAAVAILIACLAIATILVPAYLEEDVPIVAIQSPSDGAQFATGQEVSLQASATGANNLQRLELLVDGVLLEVVTSPDPRGSALLTARGRWVAGPAGPHTLSALAYASGEERSELASVKVVIVDLVSSPTASLMSPEPPPTSLPSPTNTQPAPTDTPSPTPSPSPSPTATTPPDTPSPTPSPTPTGTPTPSPTPTVLPPEIEYFRANPEVIDYGECTRLEWGKVSNATEARIDPGIGGVGTPDSLEICPSETTVYTLSATGPDGVVTMSVTVAVGSALPDLTVQSVTFVPSPPARGQDNQGQLTIYNAGEGDAGPFVWKWKAESGEVARGRLENGLESGQTTVVTFVWYLVDPRQELAFLAKVDVREEVAESDESNNRLEATTQVAGEPLGDLVLHEFDLDDDNQVIIQVGNPGGRIEAPVFQYELYQDGVLAQSGSLDTPQSDQMLYETGYFIENEHLIRVVIDPDDLIPESDTSNNAGTLACSPITHTCSGQ